MRYLVDHGVIHDRETGKHVSLHEAAAMLSVENATPLIAWGVVIDLGKLLHKAESDIEMRDVLIARIREYAKDVAMNPIGMESINKDMAALVEQARKYVAETVLEIIRAYQPLAAAQKAGE